MPRIDVFGSPLGYVSGEISDHLPSRLNYDRIRIVRIAWLTHKLNRHARAAVSDSCLPIVVSNTGDSLRRVVRLFPQFSRDVLEQYLRPKPCRVGRVVPLGNFNPDVQKHCEDISCTSKLLLP